MGNVANDIALNEWEMEGEVGHKPDRGKDGYVSLRGQRASATGREWVTVKSVKYLDGEKWLGEDH